MSDPTFWTNIPLIEDLRKAVDYVNQELKKNYRSHFKSYAVVTNYTGRINWVIEIRKYGEPTPLKIIKLSKKVNKNRAKRLVKHLGSGSIFV